MTNKEYIAMNNKKKNMKLSHAENHSRDHEVHQRRECCVWWGETQSNIYIYQKY